MQQTQKATDPGAFGDSAPFDDPELVTPDHTQVVTEPIGAGPIVHETHDVALGWGGQARAIVKE